MSAATLAKNPAIFWVVSVATLAKDPAFILGVSVATLAKDLPFFQICRLPHSLWLFI